MTAVFEPCDEGGYIAYIQELNGISSQGETIDEAKENLIDAIDIMFSELRAKGLKGNAKKSLQRR